MYAASGNLFSGSWNWHTVKFRKISPSIYKPLQIKAPQTCNTKNPPLNLPSENKPPGGGLYLEFALEYKVKQSKNGKFPSHFKLAQSI